MCRLNSAVQIRLLLLLLLLGPSLKDGSIREYVSQGGIPAVPAKRGQRYLGAGQSPWRKSVLRLRGGSDRVRREGKMVRVGRTRLQRAQPLDRLDAGCEVLEPPFEFGYPGWFRLLAFPGRRRSLRGAWLP
jgi:hypothetical protein